MDLPKKIFVGNGSGHWPNTWTGVDDDLFKMYSVRSLFRSKRPTVELKFVLRARKLA
jgi:hypothetical protein